MTPTGPGELSDFEQRILANVRNHGCHINYVFDPEGDEPAYSYSVGFPETVGQPEVIVFGLSSKLMGWMINETLRQCSDGLELVDGLEINGLLEGHVCVLCEVAPSNIVPDYFNSAIWLREYLSGEAMDAAFQIVWPGAVDGLFPWEEGCSAEVRALQPCLMSEGSVL